MSNSYGSSEYFKVQLVDDSDGTITGEDRKLYQRNWQLRKPNGWRSCYSEEYVHIMLLRTKATRVVILVAQNWQLR